MEDRAFHALSDATRRDILRRTMLERLSVSELASAYDMSFAAVQKHVAVLDAAGLVTKTRHGRQQLVSARVDALRRARDTLDGLELLWRTRIEQMGELLAQDPKE